MKRPKYAIPKRVFRQMGLGEFSDCGDRIRCVAGISRNWWEPDFMQGAPTVVEARQLQRAAIGGAQ